MISGKTEVIALIGDPVEHSISPAMHNAAFGELELDYIYVVFRVASESLKSALDGIRSLEIKGANVTIPHKTVAINHLDDLHKSARRVGAVNTIKNDSGSLKGFNTDGEGALEALEEEVGPLDGKSVLLLGAGGAARAIAFSLVDAGAKVIVANRTPSKAKDIVKSIGREVGAKIKQIELEKKELKRSIDESDILINATSVGMHPNVNETLVTSDMMHSELVVKDVVYNPLRTRLLKEAEKAGARTINGLEMLVYQGAISFKIWTGRNPPIEIMKEAAKKAIEAW